MPAVDRHTFDRHRAVGAVLFGAEPIPTLEQLLSFDAESTGTYRELETFLLHRAWMEVAMADEFRAVGSETLDLSGISSQLSRLGLRYYLPGLLLHFLRVGTYANSLVGPDFFFSFVRRIQCDDPSVLSCGGCAKYFDFSGNQRAWCAGVMWDIYSTYGDPYEKFDNRGAEYDFLARNSIARALLSFWSQN